MQKLHWFNIKPICKKNIPICKHNSAPEKGWDFAFGAKIQ
jgi:hypothetical protein